MSKSLSYVENNKEINKININDNINNNNKKNDIDLELPEYNDRPKFNPDFYKKPIPNFENSHDSDLLLGRINKNNRLDFKMQKFGRLERLKNENNFKKNIYNIKLQKCFPTDIYKNGNDTLYQKFNAQEDNTYEEQLKSLIKSN